MGLGNVDYCMHISAYSSLNTCMFTQKHTHTHDTGRIGSAQRDERQSRLPHKGLSFVYGLKMGLRISERHLLNLVN